MNEDDDEKEKPSLLTHIIGICICVTIMGIVVLMVAYMLITYPIEH